MRIPSAVLPFSFLVFAGCAAAPEVDLERETAAVTARSQAVAAAEAAKDAEQAIAFWAEDAIVQPAGRRKYRDARRSSIFTASS